MRKLRWMLGAIAAGLLTGYAEAQEKVTVIVRNHDTGEPLENVQIDQDRPAGQTWLSRIKALWSSPPEYRPMKRVASKQTDKEGKAVFDENPAEGVYWVFPNIRSPFSFEVNGNGTVVEPWFKRNYLTGHGIVYKDYSRNIQKRSGWNCIPLDEQTAYIGTYTGDSGSKGIYRIRVDKEKGIVSKPELVAEVDNPSFLAFQDMEYNNTLYAVSESSNKVLAYNTGNEDGMLTLLNEAQTGKGPCYVTARWWGLIVADYGGGSVDAWQIEKDGSIGEQSAFFQNTHASKATNRQQQPHAHGVTAAYFLNAQKEDWHCLLVPDLGADRVYVYETESKLKRIETGFETECNVTPCKAMPWIQLPPGRGPRHVAATFGDAPYHLYVLNELSNTISVFGYDADTRLFTFIEEVSTLPEGFDGQSTAAELVFDGDILYASNRGHDSIARFQRNPKTGRLTFKECTPCGGKSPRHFSIMPGGEWMLVANQNSNNISLLRMDRDGKLTLIPDGGVDIGAPVCVVFE